MVCVAYRILFALSIWLSGFSVWSIFTFFAGSLGPHLEVLTQLLVCVDTLIPFHSSLLLHFIQPHMDLGFC